MRGRGSGDSGQRSGSGGEHSLSKVTGKVASKKELLNKFSFRKNFDIIY